MNDLLKHKRYGFRDVRGLGLREVILLESGGLCLVQRLFRKVYKVPGLFKVAGA